ncbi:MAG: hypothetical protein GEU80_03000 [Dehalococcoidia bacterium]|nr:hypothetical protein [Dehalococcoidia bacterium]
MLTATDVSQVQQLIAQGRYELDVRALREFQRLGIRQAEFAVAFCSPQTELSPIGVPPDPRKGEYGLFVCKARNPPLIVTLWYISTPPRSILVEGVST